MSNDRDFRREKRTAHTRRMSSDSGKHGGVKALFAESIMMLAGNRIWLSDTIGKPATDLYR